MKKRNLFFPAALAVVLSLTVAKAHAQGMAVNATGSAAAASAILDASSTTQGVLVPRMTSAQRTAIASPAQGLLVYQTDGTPSGFYYYDGSAWTSLSTPSTATLQGNTFNGASQLVQLNASTQLPAVSGVNLTSLNATNISSGTVNDSRLSANVTVAGNSFNGASQVVKLDASSQLPVVSGANLTNLSGTNVSSGTVSDSRLSANVTVQGNTFNAANKLVQLNGSSQLPAVSGANLTNLPAPNLTGTLPAISGTNLTNLNGANISDNTITVSKLPSGAATGKYLNGNGTWDTPGGSGGILYGPVVTKSGNYTLSATDQVILVDMSAGSNITLTLPAANVLGKVLVVKIIKYNNALLPVLTLQPASGSERVDGNTNLAFGNAGGNRSLLCDGAGNWYGF